MDERFDRYLLRSQRQAETELNELNQLLVTTNARASVVMNALDAVYAVPPEELAVLKSQMWADARNHVIGAELLRYYEPGKFGTAEMIDHPGCTVQKDSVGRSVVSEKLPTKHLFKPVKTASGHGVYRKVLRS